MSRTEMIARLIFLTMAALAIGVVLMAVLAPVARSEEAPSVAAVQRAVLWKQIAMTPALADVDQIVIEGAGDTQIVSGWLMKRNWSGTEAAALEKKFWARIDQNCPAVTLGCFQVVGIWSGGQLLSHLTGE